MFCGPPLDSEVDSWNSLGKSSYISPTKKLVQQEWGEWEDPSSDAPRYAEFILAEISTYVREIIYYYVVHVCIKPLELNGRKWF